MKALLIALLITLVAGASGPLYAQQVRGHVLTARDSSAVVGATIQLRQADIMSAQTVTDSAGEFRLVAPRAGEYVIHVQHASFPSVSRKLSIASNDDVVLEVLLHAELVPLDPIRVVATRGTQLTGVGGYYDRLDIYGKLGIGRFITRETLSVGGPENPTAYLGRVPFVVIRGIGVRRVPLFRRRGGGECVPTVFYDGNAIPAAELDEVYGAAPLEGIEIYRGPAQSPGTYWDPNGCGVILVWSRKDVDQGGIRWLRGGRGVAAVAAFVVAALLLVR